MLKSFERIHRSNLVGMGILPLQFLPGVTRKSLGVTGDETVSIEGMARGIKPKMQVTRDDCRRGRQDAKSFTCCAASTHWTKWNISAMAAFCIMCCAIWRRPDEAKVPAWRCLQGLHCSMWLCLGLQAHPAIAATLLVSDPDNRQVVFIDTINGATARCGGGR